MNIKGNKNCCSFFYCTGILIKLKTHKTGVNEILSYTVYYILIIIPCKKKSIILCSCKAKV